MVILRTKSIARPGGHERRNYDYQSKVGQYENALENANRIRRENMREVERSKHPVKSIINTKNERCNCAVQRKITQDHYPHFSDRKISVGGGKGVGKTTALSKFKPPHHRKKYHIFQSDVPIPMCKVRA